MQIMHAECSLLTNWSLCIAQKNSPLLECNKQVVLVFRFWRYVLWWYLPARSISAVCVWLPYTFAVEASKAATCHGNCVWCCSWFASRCVLRVCIAQFTWKNYVLMVESWYKGSSSPSLRCSLVEEQSVRPSHWFVSLFCVPLSVLTPLVGWLDGHMTHKKARSIKSYTTSFWSYYLEQLQKKTKGNRLMQMVVVCFQRKIAIKWSKWFL